MNALILGSGPSAAYAAMACFDAGVVPVVRSDRPPEAQRDGAFFLHWLPEGWRNGSLAVPVEIIGIGTAENYSLKQWGQTIPTSFPACVRTELWYDSRVLDYVWEEVKLFSAAGKVNEQELREASKVFDFVFHSFTLPAHRMGRNYRWFPVRSIVAESDTPFRIIYNGTLQDRWVRMTQSFGGRISFEFPDEVAAELELASTPLWQAMDAAKLRDIPPATKPVLRAEWFAPNVVPIGRFATWNRKHLSHHAYARVSQVLRGGDPDAEA